MVSIAVLQLEQRVSGTKQARVADVLERLRAAPVAHILVLPELWDVGWPRFDDYPAEASPIDAGPLTALGHLARERGCMIVAGSILERTEHALFNTATVIGPDGRVLGTYRKQHLLGIGAREPEHLSPGGPSGTVETPAGRIALAIGHDLRFPGVFMEAQAAGAELIVVPAHWSAAHIEQLRPLAVARAIDTQTPVVVANAWGPSQTGAHGSVGGSIIVDARGRVLAEAGDGPGWLQAEIDLADMRQLRLEFPMQPPSIERVATTPAAPPRTPAAPGWSPPAPPAAPSAPPWGP